MSFSASAPLKNTVVNCYGKYLEALKKLEQNKSKVEKVKIKSSRQRTLAEIRKLTDDIEELQIRSASTNLMLLELTELEERLELLKRIKIRQQLAEIREAELKAESDDELELNNGNNDREYETTFNELIDAVTNFAIDKYKGKFIVANFKNELLIEFIANDLDYDDYTNLCALLETNVNNTKATYLDQIEDKTNQYHQAEIKKEQELKKEIDKIDQAIKQQEAHIESNKQRLITIFTKIENKDIEYIKIDKQDLYIIKDERFGKIVKEDLIQHNVWLNSTLGVKGCEFKRVDIDSTKQLVLVCQSPVVIANLITLAKKQFDLTKEKQPPMRPPQFNGMI